MWKLYHTLLDNQWVKEKTSKEIRKYFEINEDTTYQKLWDAVKAVLKRELIAINTFFKNSSSWPCAQWLECQPPDQRVVV